MRYKQRKTSGLYNYMGQRTYIEKFASQTSQRNTEGISREREGTYSIRANRKEGNCCMDHPGFIELRGNPEKWQGAARIPRPGSYPLPGRTKRPPRPPGSRPDPGQRIHIAGRTNRPGPSTFHQNTAGSNRPGAATRGRNGHQDGQQPPAYGMAPGTGQGATTDTRESPGSGHSRPGNDAYTRNAFPVPWMI